MDTVKQTRLDSSWFLAVTHRQFETAACHKWTFLEKDAYFAVLQGKSTYILQSVPPAVTYEYIVRPL